jgi:hypothetical protein
MILEPVPGQPRQPQAWWPNFISVANTPAFLRTAEHLVSSLNPTAAATPHGVVDMVDEEWTGEIPEAWIRDAMPASQYTNMLEHQTGDPVPSFAKLTRSAGQTVGEKQPVFSKAMDLVKVEGTVINASNYINISGVVAGAQYWVLANMLLRAAVAAEASAEMAKVVEAAAATTGWNHFTDRAPGYVVVPPSQTPNVKAADLQAMGYQVVRDPAVTKVLIVDKWATQGYLHKGSMDALEPSTHGRGLTYNTYGKLYVDPAGVSSIPNPAP